jgi:hypothetical protein
MRAKAVAAERNREVREAARAWHRAGAIDDARLGGVEAAYPDDRGRLGPVFRTLIGGFTAFGVLVALGLASLLLQVRSERAFGVLCLAFGLGLLALTELQVGPLRRAQGGAESATGLLMILFLILGVVIFVVVEMELSTGLRVLLILGWSLLVSTFAALRWGSVSAAVVAATCFFLILAQLPDGRLLWIVAGATIPAALLRASDSERLAPPHRQALVGVALIGLIALYVAIHLGSWDSGLVGWLSAWRWPGDWQPDRWPQFRGFASAATALLPVLVVAAGVWSRRRVVILAGVAMGIASLVTLRVYVHLMPLSFALLLIGTLALFSVLLIRRWLDGAPGHERSGFTAEPLFDNPGRMQLLETAAGMVSLTPVARSAETSQGFEGGGGRSGGGGATDSY